MRLPAPPAFQPISDEQIYQWTLEGKRPSEIKKLRIRNVLKHKAMLKGYYRRGRIASSAQFQSTKKRATRGMATPRKSSAATTPASVSDP